MQSARVGLFEHWANHPRIALALRAACAAAIAWLLVRFVPGAQDYPYYAPFGAVIATTSTLAGSVRESLQSVGSIIVGGTIAWLVDLVTAEAAFITVGIVVAVSVAFAGLPILGAMGGWVPTAAIFTLIIGHGEAQFIGAYAGLTLFGAIIGIVVNMLVPPLPLAPTRRAVGRMRAVLAGTLRELGDLMVAFELPPLSQWEREHGELGRARADMQDAVSRFHESFTANARARAKRHRAAFDELTYEAESLERISLLVSDVTDLVLRTHGIPGEEPAETALSDSAREPIARAMHRVADALDAYQEGDDAQSPLLAADAELDELLRSQLSDTREQLLVHSVVLALRRALDTFS